MTKEQLEKHMVKVGKRTLFIGGTGRVGDRCRLLHAIFSMLDEAVFDKFRAPWDKIPRSARAMYGYTLQERVAKRLYQELRAIEREMNKKTSRKYVHWSNSEGRYVDDGE